MWIGSVVPCMAINDIRSILDIMCTITHILNWLREMIFRTFSWRDQLDTSHNWDKFFYIFNVVIDVCSYRYINWCFIDFLHKFDYVVCNVIK